MQLHREGLSRLGYGELVTGIPEQIGLLVIPRQRGLQRGSKDGNQGYLKGASSGNREVEFSRATCLLCKWESYQRQMGAAL